MSTTTLSLEIQPFIDELVAEGSYCTGAQIAVAVKGQIDFTSATGTTLGGARMTTRTLHKVYCATKPILGLVTLMLCNPSLIVEPLSALNNLSISQILQHNAGLGAPSLLEWRLASESTRHSLIDEAKIQASTRRSYSEVTAGLMLAEYLEEQFGFDIAAFSTTAVLAPLGIENDLLVDERLISMPVYRKRLAVPFAGPPDRRIAMLSERVLFDDIHPGIGGVATAESLCILFSEIELALNNIGPLHERFSSPLGDIIADPECSQDEVLRKPCGFAGFLMCNLEDHGFGDLLSATSVGHTGANGHTFVFADPNRGVTMAAYFNVASPGLSKRDEQVRITLIDTLIHKLDGIL